MRCGKLCVISQGFQMRKEKKPEQFIRHPSYPGGIEAMRAFIRQQLRYPEEALKNNVEGTVAVSYEVDHLGNVINTKIKSGIGSGCDEEALRITKLLKFVVPPHKGLRVTFHKTINIHFRLPAAPKPTAKTQLSYNYVEKKKEGKPAYTYNISIN